MDIKYKLTDTQRDYLTELFNIGIGKASSVLSEMLEKPVSLHIPEVSLVDIKEISSELENLGYQNRSSVSLGMEGNVEGIMFLLFSDESAKEISKALETDESDINTVIEIANIVLNSVIGTFGNILNEKIDYTSPVYSKKDISSQVSTVIKNTQDKSFVLFANTFLSVESIQVETAILITIDLKSYSHLLSLVDKITKGFS